MIQGEAVMDDRAAEDRLQGRTDPETEALRHENRLMRDELRAMDRLAAALSGAEVRIRALESRLDHETARRAAAETALEAAHRSHSWRLTAPLRALRGLWPGRQHRA